MCECVFPASPTSMTTSTPFSRADKSVATFQVMSHVRQAGRWAGKMVKSLAP